MTLSRFEVFPSNKTLFNYKAGSTPQDTSVSIITLVIILCLKQHAAYCYYSQQSSKWFDGRRFSARNYRRFGRIFHIFCPCRIKTSIQSDWQFRAALENHWIVLFLFWLHSQCIKISRTSAEQSSGRQVVLNYHCEGHLAVILFMQVSFLVVNPSIFVAFLF